MKNLPILAAGLCLVVAQLVTLAGLAYAFVQHASPGPERAAPPAAPAQASSPTRPRVIAVRDWAFSMLLGNIGAFVFALVLLVTGRAPDDGAIEFLIIGALIIIIPSVWVGREEYRHRRARRTVERPQQPRR